MQAYHLMTAAMMQITIPVASPPRNTPTSVAIFDVSGCLASCGSGAMIGLGSSTCGSGIMVECGSSTGVSDATVERNSSTCGSRAMVECGFSTGISGIKVTGLGRTCGSAVQKGVHTLTMVAV